MRVKEWVTTRPRDLPVAGRRCELRWRKRRWYCDEPGCPRGRSPSRCHRSRPAPG
ncbi:transposase family protein [Nonomuraea sp. JJY05]|uniref:transposase family protein n=1 Tax=Nonomuraea sp. JJY05 TaxID=3350255 RepID=UPI00373FA8E7